MKITELTSGSGTGNSEALRRMNTKEAELVSFKHNFRNLSNTTDFYYQQRFNSFDSEDALTVQQHLDTIERQEGFWTREKVIEALHLAHLRVRG